MSNFNDSDIKMCFICLENEGDIVRVCNCKGTINGVHRECLDRWLEEKKLDHCTICKYKYTYDYYFEPSCNRFRKKHFKCEEENIYEDNEIEDFDNYNDNLFLFFFLVFLFIIHLLLSIALLESVKLLIGILWGVFFGSFIFLYLVKWKRNSIRDPFYIFKYTNLILSIGGLILTAILYSEYQADCNNQCLKQKKICDRNCSYYPTYEKTKNDQIDMYYSKLTNFGVVILMDLIHKIKDYLCVKKIAEVNDNSYSYLFQNKIYPLDD